MYNSQSCSFADPVVITYTAASSRVEGEDQVYEVTFTTETAFMIPFELTLNLVNGTATGVVCVTLTASLCLIAINYVLLTYQEVDYEKFPP